MSTSVRTVEIGITLYIIYLLYSYVGLRLGIGLELGLIYNYLFTVYLCRARARARAIQLGVGIWLGLRPSPSPYYIRRPGIPDFTRGTQICLKSGIILYARSQFYGRNKFS